MDNAMDMPRTPRRGDGNVLPDGGAAGTATAPSVASRARATANALTAESKGPGCTPCPAGAPPWRLAGPDGSATIKDCWRPRGVFKDM